MNRTSGEPLQEILEHVISEHQTIRPDAKIISSFNLNEPVYCDGNRIADLLSNLLGNALAHGNAADPIFVDAMTEEGEFELSVTNSGDQIPEQLVGRLFEPFARGQVKKGQDGLGLGLYIASEIARAHSGTIEVVSNTKETCFTFKMPAHLNELNN